MHLHLAPERHLHFSLALKQAVEILQMPQLELAIWLEGEVEKNPLLELHHPQTFQEPPEIASSISLYEHLCKEVQDTFLDPTEKTIAQTLIGYLDEKGFLSTPLEEIEKAFGWQVSTIEKVLEKVQSFDPAGIGSKNIKQSFLIQLRSQNLSQSIAYSIIEGYFDDFLHGRYIFLKKKLKLEPGELQTAIQMISRLSLRPASNFKAAKAPSVRADLRAIQVDGSWLVEMIDEDFPSIRIRPDLAQLVAKLANAEKKSVKRWLTGAKWLIRSLNRRNQLLLSLSSCLLNTQQTQKISPKSLAQKLGVHEASIHRALSDKIIEGPWGTIPLKSLLPRSAANEQHKQLLQKLICDESKEKPLSDQELAALLQNQGVQIARRTVAKYRRQLNVASACHRKQIV